METTAEFSCRIATTDPTAPLGVEIWFDDQCVFDVPHVTETQVFRYKFPDTVGSHRLAWVLKNKRISDTRVGEAGNILKDAKLIVNDINFDGIPLGHVLTKQAVYTHSYNDPDRAVVNVPFYEEMGCNGTVSLEFTTPIYLWLLEHTQP